MKKIIIFILTFVFLFSVASCKKNTDDKKIITTIIITITKTIKVIIQETIIMLVA